MPAASRARLLGPAELRALASEAGLRPTKKLGQNFVHDPNTIRRITRLAELGPDDVVLEIGAGLGSLTLGLAETGARVIAVELDPALAAGLPATLAERGPPGGAATTVLLADALRLRASDLPAPPDALVANLPYNVAVPVVLHTLGEFPELSRALVLVQSEVADRMAAAPGSRTYGAPSVKLAWFGRARKVGTVGRAVFWPVPNVDSALVRFDRSDPPVNTDREAVFTVIDAAFSARRKTLRAALAAWAGTAARAGEILTAAGIDPAVRAEQLGPADFAAIADARAQRG